MGTNCRILSTSGGAANAEAASVYRQEEGLSMSGKFGATSQPLAHKVLGRHELDNLLLGRGVIHVNHGDLLQRCI